MIFVIRWYSDKPEGMKYCTMYKLYIVYLCNYPNMTRDLAGVDLD